MRQKKSLVLNSKISLEAMIFEDKIELSFVVGKKEYRITDNEILELRDWLSKEIVRDFQLLPIIGLTKAEQTQKEKEQAEKSLVASAAKSIPFDQQVAAKAFSKEHIFEGTPQT